MFTNAMRLDQILGQDIHVNLNATKYPDAYGVEVELEGANVADAGFEVLELWLPHHDQSLRNHHGQAIEYVFRGPYDMAKTELAINRLFDFLNTPPVKVAPSYRTSIHVHVNFAAETYRTIYNFICLSIVLDELLVSQNGDHRIGNNFCLRARDAMGQTNSITKSIENGNEFFGINQNERYSSINFASLLKFGTVEFRSLECTTHKGRLLHWINTLAHIKKVSKTFKDPSEIISAFSRMGEKEFLYMVLGPYAIKYSTVVNFESMLRYGMRIAQDFAYCSEWNTKKTAKEMPGNKKKFYHKAAPNQFVINWEEPDLQPQPPGAAPQIGNWAIEP